jgi:oxygen-independent coproporphyrinogen-3 oxidase
MSTAPRESHVRALRPSGLSVLTRDGVTLALHRVPGAMQLDAPILPPVLLVHGTCSNRRAMLGAAGFLARRGFEAFVLETRGHGESERGPVDSDFDDVAEHDIGAAIDAVLEATGAPALFLMGHSGGGLAALMHLARHPERARQVKGVVTLASQATHAARRKRRRGLVLAAAAVTRAIGYFPGKAIRVGPENELGGVMDQWFRWSWDGRWRARDGFDYERALAAIELPILALAGPLDRAIAPPEGCRRVLDALGGHDKRFVLCAKASGFARDFGHADLVMARHAQAEVWPLVEQWMQERAGTRALADEQRGVA